MLELWIFDFDGTLFRSPEIPSWWPQAEKGNFYIHQDSLGRPCVPDRPDDSWWVGSVVSEARKAIANPNVLAILCTGRPDNLSFRWRVPELLKQKGLDFDGVFLSRKSSVREFKAQIVRRYLDKHTEIKTIRMWEDTQRNLDVIEAVTRERGLDFIPHFIKVPAHPVACSRETYFGMDPWADDPAVRVANRWFQTVLP